MFLDENSRINLSAHRTAEACWVANVLDSLALLEVLPQIGSPGTILDLGSGGGFPALPLAIALPHTTVTALDSVRKKMEAVKRIAERIQLTNLSIAIGRAEELGRNRNMREHFDIVTARAVSALPVLLEYCSPFVRNGGWIVLWKSLDIADELTASARAQSELRCALSFRHEYDLGGDWGRRQLLIFRKEAPLGAQYPRPVGEPGKQPL